MVGLAMVGLTIIPGSELEIYDENCHGPIHVLMFFFKYPYNEKLLKLAYLAI